MRRPLFVFLVLLVQGGCRHDLTLCRDENDGPACQQGADDALVDDGAVDGELEAKDDEGTDSIDSNAPVDTGPADSDEVIDAIADADLSGSDGDGDSGSAEAGVTDSSGADTWLAADTFVADTFVADTFVADTFVADTLVADTFVADTFVADTYKPDTYVADAYVADTYVADTFNADTSVADTYVADSYVADTAPTCTVGSYKCGGAGGNDLLQCSGSAYSTVVSCPVGACSASLGRCTFCSPGAYSCSGASRQQCDSFGSKLTTIATCSTPELCAASAGSACNSPVCATDYRSCGVTGPSWAVETCNAGRTGFVSTPCSIDCVGGQCLTISAISGGAGSEICALLSNGTVRCWGSTAPGPVPGISTAVQIAVGFNWTGARMADGTVRYWIGGSFGGSDGAWAPGSNVPVAGLTGVTDLAAGFRHGCVRLSGGATKCWGSNMYGQLGALGGDAIPPTFVSPSGTAGASGIFAGRASSYATTATNFLAWGWNESGVLGTGTVASASTPTPAFSGAVAVSVGYDHACALSAVGTVSCAGLNSTGALGDGSTADRATPAPVLGLDGQVAQVSLGRVHSCALLKDSSVRCWGGNVAGQVGDGTKLSRTYPVPVTGVSGVKQLASSDSATCALMSDQQTVMCWGGLLSGDSTSPVALAWH